jgi:hypothetical protein
MSLSLKLMSAQPYTNKTTSQIVTVCILTL